LLRGASRGSRAAHRGVPHELGARPETHVSGREPDASVKGQYHARLPCRGWRSQRGMWGTRPARIARSADAAAAVKPPAFGVLDRPRTEASAGRAVPRLSRRLSPAATCGARGSPSVPLSRPVPTRDVPRVGLLTLRLQRRLVVPDEGADLLGHVEEPR